jgi:xanthine dehydrogenase molybdopterin-binding subunit B
VTEVEVDDAGKIRIPRVDIAADVGTVINPDRVKSQLEGASVFGASIALMSEITAANAPSSRPTSTTTQSPESRKPPSAPTCTSFRALNPLRA